MRSTVYSFLTGVRREFVPGVGRVGVSGLLLPKKDGLRVKRPEVLNRCLCPLGICADVKK